MTAAAVALLPAAPALASTSADGTPAQAQSSPDPSGPSRVEKPDGTLPKGWRTSDDRAVTVVGDSRGLHVLVADSTEAYQWREAAALREDGFDTDAWIGNICVTGSGSRAVVAYAPRAFTNTPALFDRGAFAAVVDLETRKVTKLREQVSLAYFNPGCGTGETAVLTQSAEETGRTRLLQLNAATGKLAEPVTVRGEATSAVPVGDAMVAAVGNRLTRIKADGTIQLLSRTSGPAFRLHPDATGGVAFLERENRKNGAVTLRRVAGGRSTALAHGALGKVGLAAGTGGRLFLTGAPRGVAQLPDTVKRLDASVGTEVSSHGRLVIERAVSTGLRSHVSSPLVATADESALPYSIEARVPATDEQLEFTVPAATPTVSEQLSPALKSAAATGTLAAADSSTSTSDPERMCAVPRNDAQQQALQPTPNQVEWAVDMAIRGNLTSGYITQGGWRAQAGLGSSVSPSTMFPLPALKGAAAGTRIPAQVLLGVLAQESNMWQASYHSLPGQTGNPLIGNFYGTNIYPGTTGYDPDKIWDIDWAEADCGYGMGQQTDGMSIAARQQPGKPGAFPEDQQRAIALDYTANVAVAAQTLSNKWNELHTDGQTVEINDDDPQNIENWFAAVWNYNLGFNTPDSTGKWGLGWLNNPANPKYPADRNAFLDNNSYADAAHPQHWPYPEKVMGWAAFPIDTGRSYSDAGVEDDGNTHGYQAAWWNGTIYRTTAIKPPLDAFCNETNGCDYGNPPECTTEACYTQYWYDGNASWKDCSGSCGFETLTYKTLRSELGRGNSGMPECDANGLPAGAMVVDDVGSDVGSFRTDCTKSYINSGSMSWDFAATSGTYQGKEDLHQVGGGLGSHFWFAHTRDSAHRIGNMRVTGTWTLDSSLHQWSRVFVHLPDTGAHTQQAHYVINGVKGGARDRYLNQHFKTNTWVELGTYEFDGTASVSLSNQTSDGDGTADDDVAWDAVAFAPLSAKPQHMVVAMGDSYTSGEGAGSYSPESDTNHGTAQWNACRRSDNSWPRKVILPFDSKPIGELADAHDSSMDFQNITCSGAHTWQLTAGDPTSWGIMGNYHEKSQIDSGALSADTTLVMLTIGGNDDDTFTKAVTDCYVIGVCDEDDYSAAVDKAVEDTGSLLGDIAAAAPNARIVLMGYPHLVADDPCLTANFDALNGMADRLHDGQKAKVDGLKQAGLKVAFADPIPAFRGHGICDDDEWINRVVVGPNGDGDFHAGDPSAPCIPEFLGGACASLESFHPKNAGTTGYAQVMDQVLADIGYTGG